MRNSCGETGGQQKEFLKLGEFYSVYSGGPSSGVQHFVVYAEPSPLEKPLTMLDKKSDSLEDTKKN